MSNDDATVAVELVVDGKRFPLKAFPARALAGVLRGFLAALDGLPEDPARVEVTFTARD